MNLEQVELGKNLISQLHSETTQEFIMNYQ
jgi:hypothetical protein